MNIYERLEQDHREMAGMMDKLESGYDARVFEKLANELTAHMRAEEEVLYRPLRDAEPAHEPVLEGYEEHHVGDLILRELKANNPGTDRWMAKFNVLKENVEHHIEEEEGPLFDAARQVLPDERAVAMVREFQAEKKRH